ncbi:hypothetical protein JK358_28595 [Nocardia sp. 2]|uniref:Transposase IS701-like DDE domain-containing protein n=1 Tax=Nocardia acididurans TaxID=2802282 RepID=A0ABS1MCT1_9NOCA|nr:hypothetical protein [Nocardia acididurans]MBL1078371.1 hypothetical protein [Nocardia acididurans]
MTPLAGMNGWTLVEAVGEATSKGIQRLLNAAAWDVDGVGDDIPRREVSGRPDSVLVVDEQVPKKVRNPPGYNDKSGTSGRIEDCRLTMSCAYTKGHD